MPAGTFRTGFMFRIFNISIFGQHCAVFFDCCGHRHNFNNSNTVHWIDFLQYFLVKTLHDFNKLSSLITHHFHGKKYLNWVEIFKLPSNLCLRQPEVGDRTERTPAHSAHWANWMDHNKNIFPQCVTTKYESKVSTT